MRPVLLAAALALAAGPALAADPVEGVWFNQAKSGKVSVAPCSGQADRMCGTISWLRDNPAEKDTHNPDPAKRGRPVLGMPVFWGFKQSGPGKWAGGKIYDPESGKTYDSKLAYDNGVLKVSGCVLVVCQSQTWTRP